MPNIQINLSALVKKLDSLLSSYPDTVSFYIIY